MTKALRIAGTLALALGWCGACGSKYIPEKTAMHPADPNAPAAAVTMPGATLAVTDPVPVPEPMKMKHGSGAMKMPGDSGSMEGMEGGDK